jgi:hypothetical protein
MRIRAFFLGLAALTTATGVIACGGVETAVPRSDAGINGTAVDRGSDGGNATSPDATTDATSPADAGSDGGDATSPDATTDAPSPADSGDAGADAEPGDATDAADAADAGPFERASLRLGPGSEVIGVTSDDYVIYWIAGDAGAGYSAKGTLAAISTTGADPRILSTTANGTRSTDGARFAVVAGSTVVWLDSAGLDAGTCNELGFAIWSWSSAQGKSLVAPFTAGAELTRVGPTGTMIPGQVAVSADGSQVAYPSVCTWPSLTAVAIAPTSGKGAPLTAALSPGPNYANLSLDGTTVTVDEDFSMDGGGSRQVVFGGNPLALTISNANDCTTDPTGTWVWEPASAGGMELVRASDGSVVFTDPGASSLKTANSASVSFDAAGSNLFYTSAEGVKHIALAAPTTAATLAGTSGVCGEALVVAPNGESLVCITARGDGGSTYTVVTTGATPSTFTLPATTGYVGFLPDSTLIWQNDGLFAAPVLGGPVTTVATSAQDYAAIGGSQVVVEIMQPSRRELVVDATGKLPTFQLNPTPETRIFAPQGGGVVAYGSGGAIYAVKTN